MIEKDLEEIVEQVESSESMELVEMRKMLAEQKAMIDGLLEAQAAPPVVAGTIQEVAPKVHAIQCNQEEYTGYRNGNLAWAIVDRECVKIGDEIEIKSIDGYDSFMVSVTSVAGATTLDESAPSDIVSVNRAGYADGDTKWMVELTKPRQAMWVKMMAAGKGQTPEEFMAECVKYAWQVDPNRVFTGDGRSVSGIDGSAAVREAS